MRVILATNQLGLGGSESYLLTVAEQLDRLGHEPVVFTREPGAGAVLARRREIEVVSENELPPACDAVLVQDAGVSLELAKRFPHVSQVFVAHSEIFDLQLPPQLEGIVHQVVALNDRVLRRLRALAVKADTVRLRQPIDIERFAAGPPLPERPARALLLSNNPVSDRLAMLEAACGEVGIELVRVGGEAGQTDDPAGDLRSADIVIGYGRSVLEAMACGRAAYVYDRHGGDGWVTAESYGGIEASGFGGRTGNVIVDAARLRADLDLYDPAMGPVNHDIVAAHHRANDHVQELVGLLEAAGARPAEPRSPLDEMARLVRLEWRMRSDAQALVGEVTRLSQEGEQLRDEIVRQRGELDRQAAEAEERVEAVRRSYANTLSWRVTRPLRRLRRMRWPFRAYRQG